MISNSRNKLHQTMYEDFFSALYIYFTSYFTCLLFVSRENVAKLACMWVGESCYCLLSKSRPKRYQTTRFISGPSTRSTVGRISTSEFRVRVHATSLFPKYLTGPRQTQLPLVARRRRFPRRARFLELQAGQLSLDRAKGGRLRPEGRRPGMNFLSLS